MPFRIVDRVYPRLLLDDKARMGIVRQRWATVSRLAWYGCIWVIDATACVYLLRHFNIYVSSKVLLHTCSAGWFVVTSILIPEWLLQTENTGSSLVLSSYIQQLS